MIVRKFSEAKAYEAPNHRDYKSYRLFGAEMGGSQSLIFDGAHGGSGATRGLWWHGGRARLTYTRGTA